MFTLSPLPYSTDALEPHISARTLELHHGKHHKSYVDKLNTALEDEGREDEADLLDIIRSSEGHLFNMAAQVWNHAFYWQCLSPDGGGSPPGDLEDALRSEFGSLESFREAFSDAAASEFGSGWAWLARRPDGSLHVVNTSDAENPVTAGDTPLLTLDVWEHAYYLDYQNRRPDYIDAFFSHLLNWDFVAENFGRSAAGRTAPDEGVAAHGSGRAKQAG